MAQQSKVTKRDFIELEKRMQQRFMAGDDAVAAEMCVQLVDIFHQLVPNDDGRMKGRATVFIPIMAYGGLTEEAVELADNFVKVAEQKHGPNHATSHDARFLRDILTTILQLPRADVVRLANAERDSRRAEQLLKQGDYRTGIKSLMNVLEVREKLLGTDNPLHVVDLMKLSYAMKLASAKTGGAHLDQALQYMQYSRQAWVVVRKILPEKTCPGGHPLVASVGENLGAIAIEMQQFAIARGAFSGVLTEQRKLYPESEFPKGHEKLLDAMIGLSFSLAGLRSYDAASTLVEEGLAMSKNLSPRGSARAARLYLNKAQIALARSNLGVARQAVYGALGLFQDFQENRDEASPEELRIQCVCLGVLISVEFRQGNYINAEGYAELAMKWLHKAYPQERFPNGHVKIAGMLTRLATTKSRLEKFEEAEPLYEQAIEMYRALSADKSLPREEISLAQTLGSFGLSFLRQHQYDKAIEYLQQDVDILDRVLANGNAQVGQEEIIRALMQLGAAMQRAGAAPEQWYPNLERAVDVAHAYYSKETFPQGHPLLMAALRTLMRGKALASDHSEAVSLLVELIDMHFNYVAVELTRSDVESLEGELDMLKLELDWLLTYAYVSREQEPRFSEIAYRWIAAQKTIVLDTLIRARRQQRELANDEELAGLISNLERIRRSMQEFALNPPSDWTAEQIADARREREARLKYGETALMLTIAKRGGNIPSGQVSLNRIRKELARRNGAVLIDVIRMNPLDLNAKEVGSIRRIPTHYMAFVVSPIADTPPRIVDLGRAVDIDRLIEELRTEIRDAPKSLRFASEEQLVEQYREKAYELYQRIMAPLNEELDGVETIFIAPDGELNRIAFEALVDKQGKYLIENHTFAYLSSGSDLLRQPSEPGEGAVIFANPDYNLGLVERKQQLAEMLKDESELEATDLAVRSLPEDVTRGLSWAPLRASAKEAELLEKLLADSDFGVPTTFTGSQALEDYLKRIKRPRLLHLATHGFYLPEPSSDVDTMDEVALFPSDGHVMASQLKGRLSRQRNPLFRSGIVLAGANAVVKRQNDGSTYYGDPDDGWVTAEEVAMLDLRGTKLVVLSACETGLADIRNGENVSGLRRAFMHAGAESLVTSLYQVPDASTQELMTLFYTNLREQSPREALHDAVKSYMIDRREAQGVAHPFFWASFIFVGTD